MLNSLQRENLMAKHQLIKAARAVIHENAAFEDMTQDHAIAMRALQAAIGRIDRVITRNITEALNRMES